MRSRRSIHDVYRLVLDFWFAEPGSCAHGKSRKEWFRKSAAFDDQIRQKFGTLVDGALDGQLDHWGTNAAALPNRVALIIVLDQFTRNIFRDTPAMVAGDDRALDCAQRLVATGDDQHLLPVQRLFCYLPFEHAEDMAMQHESIRLFSELADYPVTADMITWARKHCDVVERFGRFPHRNAILGRTSTAEELAFLAQPGSSF